MRRALWILAVLLSHWRRHKMQFAALLIGLISATALWSGVQAINQQARNAYDRAAATFGGARTAMLVAPDAATFSQELFVKLRRAGWPVSPMLEGRVQVNGRSVRLLGIEPVTLPADVGNAPRLGASDLGSFIAPPGQTLVARETLSDVQEQEGATPPISNGAKLPPLRVLPQLVPDVLVVDIGVAQRLLNKPDQISRLLIGKPKGKPAPLASVVGDQLQRVEPNAETETGAPHRQLSSQPHGVRPAVVLCRSLHRQFGRRSRLRTAAADAAHAAGLRRLGATGQHRAGDRAGGTGAGRRPDRAGVRLFHCRRALARRRGVAARALWRADPGTAHAALRMVARGYRHQHCRRAGRGRDQPDQGGQDAGAGDRAAARLATEAAPLADPTEWGCMRRVSRSRCCCSSTDSR
ncbi:hypothetical protein ACVWYI_001014 [Bradyrhizobium sp. LB13.1]